MQNSVKIYRPRKSTTGAGLVVLVLVFFGLTLPLIIEGAPIETKKLSALICFWLIGILLTIVPLMFKLEVGENYVKSYFLGFCVRNIHSADIEVLEYGNLMRFGGLGMGKGVKAWERTKNGGLKYFSLGEGGYGRNVIEEVRRVLSKK